MAKVILWREPKVHAVLLIAAAGGILCKRMANPTYYTAKTGHVVDFFIFIHGYFHIYVIFTGRGNRRLRRSDRSDPCGVRKSGAGFAETEKA